MAYGTKPAGKAKAGVGPYGSTGGPASPGMGDKGKGKKVKIAPRKKGK